MKHFEPARPPSWRGSGNWQRHYETERYGRIPGKAVANNGKWHVWWQHFSKRPVPAVVLMVGWVALGCQLDTGQHRTIQPRRQARPIMSHSSRRAARPPAAAVRCSPPAWSSQSSHTGRPSWLIWTSMVQLLWPEVLDGAVNCLIPFTCENSRILTLECHMENIV